MLIHDGEDYDDCGGNDSPGEERNGAPEIPAIFGGTRSRLAGKEGVFFFNVSFRRDLRRRAVVAGQKGLLSGSHSSRWLRREVSSIEVGRRY